MHRAVVRETSPRELRTARAFALWGLAAGVVLLVLSGVSLYGPLGRLMPRALAAGITISIGVFVGLVLPSIIMGPRRRILRTFGEYVEWECEACGRVRLWP